jgi:hypothetical protein
MAFIEASAEVGEYAMAIATYTCHRFIQVPTSFSCRHPQQLPPDMYVSPEYAQTYLAHHPKQPQ